MEPRKLLRPWRKAFRRLRAVEDEYDDDTDVLWLDFGSYGRTNHVVGYTMEGLELLLWLARVSVEDFQDVVDELWPEQESLEGELSFRSFRCQRIGIRLRMDTYSYLTGLGFTSQSLWELEASHEYVEARGVIQQVLLERGASDVELLQKPEILVYLLRRTGYVFFKTLPLILNSIKRCLDSPNNSEDHQFHLRVTKLELEGDPINTNDHKLIAQLNALATCGVKLLGGRFKPLDKTSKRAARAKFTDLQTLLYTHEHVAQTSTDGSEGLWAMKIDCDESSPPVPPGLFSALTATRSLRHISIASYGDMGVHAIESIGLALFSSLARHSIENVTLELDGEVLQRLLQTVQRADDPLAVVYDDRAASIRAHQHLRATASRFALYDPTTHVKKKNIVVDTHEHTELRIIDYKRPWWCVLLPAWDEAWVHDKDIRVTTVPSVPVARVGIPSVRKITAICLESELGHVTALVMAINPSVEDLDLAVNDTTAPDDAWATVVPSFPNLHRLSLDVLPRHLAALVSAIGSLGLHRSLHTLEVGVGFKCDELRLLGDWIDVLSNPSHAVSQCLELLVLDGQLKGSRSDEVDALTHRFETMLKTNRRLVTLRLRGETSRANLASSTALEQVLLTHHGSLVSVAAGSLGRRQKLAFLSTMQSAYRRASTKRLLLLDSETISIVFGFAARCRRRTVSVSVVQTFRI